MSSRKARPTDEVEINLTISSSHSPLVDIRENYQFTLGQNELLPPLETAITTLSEGQRTSITFPIAPFFRSEEAAQLAGFQSLEEVLTASIELLTVSDAALKASQHLLPKEDLLAMAQSKKEFANKCLQAHNHSDAIGAYRDAVTVLRSLGGDWPEGLLKKQRMHLEVICLSNLAHVLILQHHFAEAVKAATEAIAIDPKFTKAWYRRALAYWKFGEVEKSRVDVNMAWKLEPGNQDVMKLRQDIQGADRGDFEKKMFRV